MKRKACPEAQLLNEYADGHLPSRRALAVRGHAENCAACQHELARIEGLRSLLQESPVPEPGAGLRAEIGWRVAQAEPIASLSCRQARRLMGEELDRRIQTAAGEQLWAHLFNCERCLRRYQDMRRLISVTRIPAPAASPELARRIRVAVAGLAPAPQRRLQRRWAPAGAAIAAAALALVLVVSQRGPAPNQMSVPSASPKIAATIPPAALPAPQAVSVEQPSLAARSAARLRALVFPTAPASQPRVASVMPAPPAENTTRPANGSPPLAPAPEVRPAEVGLAPPAPMPPAASSPGDMSAALVTPPEHPALRAASPPPPRIAALPPAPPPATPVEAPAVEDHPLITHEAPAGVRQLRWVPVQPSSVVVFERQGGSDKALAEAGRALTRYERTLKRSQQRALVIAH